MAKLTLSVDEQVVEQAKRYAARHDTSVSRLVEGYLKLLAVPTPSDQPIPPVVARLRGCLKDSKLDERDYRRHLERKYR